jgi:hypothetical protein
MHLISIKVSSRVALQMTISDWMIIFATLIGPILAVQSQKYLERSREKSERRLQIFRVLMSTRAASLSQAHVEALNSIALDFYGKKKSYRAVVDAWKNYLDHLSPNTTDPAVWGQRRLELFIELLYKMAPTVGYEFSKVEISREIYSPTAHEKMELQQQAIRDGMADLLNGEKTLRVEIVDHNPQGSNTA